MEPDAGALFHWKPLLPYSAMTDKQPISPQAPVPESFVLRQVAWSEALDFCRIFRAFRLAIQPANWLVALLAIVCIYSAGRLLDGVWGPQVLPGEISTFQTMNAAHYRAYVLQAQDNRQQLLTQVLDTYAGNLSAARIQAESQNPRAAYTTLCHAFEKQFHRSVADSYKITPTAADGTSIQPAKLRRRAAKMLLAQMMAIRHSAGRGIFDALLKFECHQFSRLIDNSLGLIRVAPDRAAVSPADDPTAAPVWQIQVGLAPRSIHRLWKSDTVVGCLANMCVTGPGWLLLGAAPMQKASHEGAVSLFFRRTGYLLSLLAFLVISLAAIAFAGAFICRYSALKLSGAQPESRLVVRFVRSHLGSFIKAPLLPLATIIGTSIGFGLIAMVGAIPIIGEVLIGFGFVVFLIGGLIIMLMVLGLLGGASLIYPTLAVEGSDSFDAISRSFSYVYSRPWRMLFYSICSLIYGALTYLFLTVAVFVLLYAAHAVVAGGMSFFGTTHGWYTGGGKLDSMWATPRLGRLIPPINWWAMNWSEYAGAIGLYFWLFMLVSLLGAFVMSFYFSSSTIIYLLVRQHVDGQPVTDIFTETSAGTPENGRRGLMAAGTPAGQPKVEPPENSGSPPAGQSDEGPADRAGPSSL